MVCPEFFADVRQLVQHLPQPRPRDPHQPRPAPRDAGDDHRAAGQQIDVPRELARPVGHDVAVVVGGVDDLDRARFDDEQVQVGVARSENGLAVLEGA